MVCCDGKLHLLRIYLALASLDSNVDPFFGLGGGGGRHKLQKFQKISARAAKMTIVYV